MGGIRQLGRVDVNDRGVGFAQLFHAVQCGNGNALGQLQCLVIGHGKTDILLQPGCAGGFYMYALVILADKTAHNRIDGELVAARVYAQLESVGESELFDGEIDHQQIFVELFLELYNVAHILYTLVEAAGKFGRNGLHRHFFLCQSVQYEEHLNGGLRRIHLVHRDFGNEIAGSLLPGYMSVDTSCLPGCKEIFFR
ncbi:MAG: hypothetical protein BWY95_00566 [Bacteroidetes bacterium ADurb.BinA104]|nr:MAG: hypothetical protein BWY95_00566 [Bacteroidetes bacterium ADurb.BinA104]